ncbi:MAG: hypothetical protein ACYC27_15430 [Armatimonadota bacterium]
MYGKVQPVHPPRNPAQRAGSFNDPTIWYHRSVTLSSEIGECARGDIDHSRLTMKW